MINRDEVWEDLKEAKTLQLSCLHYVDKKRKFNRCYNYAIIVIAAMGALTFFINHWSAFVSTLVVTIMEILKSILPAMVQSEKELDEIDDLATFFGENTYKLEELWRNNESGHGDNDQLQNKFSNIQKKVAEKVTKTNKLIHSLSKKEDKMIQDKVSDYLKRKYYGEKN